MSKIEVSRSEYMRELAELSVKARRRRTLRSEYFRNLALIRWHPERREELLTRARGIRSAIAALDRDIARERELIARKVIKPPPPKNKLVAMHKRWFYKSPRGTYHDISVEMCATIIIPGTERKEDYETMLIDALEDYMYSQPGFERLTDLSQEVVGFVETPTDKPIRGIEIEAIEWWHSIPKTPQLKITDFLG